jgi:hypothetical protein
MAMPFAVIDRPEPMEFLRGVGSFVAALIRTTDGTALRVPVNGEGPRVVRNRLSARGREVKKRGYRLHVHTLRDGSAVVAWCEKRIEPDVK